MGAGGSTAVSCSSLDLANHNTKHQYRRQQQLLLLQQDQRMQKCKKQLPKASSGLRSSSSYNNNGNRLAQSSSHFDLSQDYRVISTGPEASDFSSSDMRQQHLQVGGSGHWLDTNQSEAYSLSNANFGVARPVLVLPPLTSNGKQQVTNHHQRNHLNKKGNAGVASRIQQRQQAETGKQLKKFSDSLPSLNNLHDHQISPPQQKPKNHHAKQCNETHTNGSSIIFNHHPHSPAAPVSTTDYLRHIQRQQQRVSSSPNSKSAKYMHGNSNSNSNNNQLFIDLVNDNSHLPLHHRQQRQHWLASPPIAVNHNDAVPPVSRQLMKRATSLSSLHNLHSHHHKQPHLTYFGNERQSPMAGDRNGNVSRQQLVSNLSPSNINHSHHARKKAENIANSSSCDLHQRSAALAGPTSKPQANHFSQSSSNPLSKRILKFRQVTQSSGKSSKKYKQKQQQQKLLQHQQQQGCPVLPPLPRSQSLHELIQLRATENGQRMRTTGTLRGSLSGNGEGNKVNLVAELLENRRQQKMNEDQVMDAEENTNANSIETMTSQSSSACSSTDDGIHDISLSVDQSTGDSRNQFSASRNSGNARQQNIIRASFGEDSQVDRQRFFKKNTQQQNAAYGHRRFSQQPDTKQMQESRLKCQNKKDSPEIHDERSDRSQGAHKSTLKRSLSHSTLQTNLANLNLDSCSNNDDDGNESDDLNELARFLYQFKQRQRATAMANANSGSSGSKSASVVAKEQQDINLDRQRIAADLSLSNGGDSNNSTSNAANLQQSPNSTTSSSGFASSTCTSNSLTSYASEEIKSSNGNRNQQQQKSNYESSNKKLPARKKYPAPPIPGEQQINSMATTSNGAKCVISGELKLSSSLLSIVDEYNSSLQSNEHSSPSRCSTNLTSVLLGEHQKFNEESRLKKCDDRNRSKKLIVKSNNHYDDHHDHEQLERLRRYTELRQMSQSELALNHLTSPTSLNQKSKQKELIKQEQCVNKQPYKSKIINIIRRISDKSESSNDGFGNQQECKARQKQDARKLKVINQDENLAKPIVHHANQFANRQSKYVATSSNLNGKFRLAASESLCDLNFDCDLELIRNCGAITAQVDQQAGHTRHQQQQQQQPASGSLLSCQPGAAEGHQATGCQKERQLQQQKLIDSSKKDEKNNNWHLVPASLASVNQHKRIAPTNGCAITGKELSMKGEEKDCRLINGQKQTKDKPSAGKQPPTKLKWSASSWLMNVNSSSSSNFNGSAINSKKSKKKEQLPDSKDDLTGKSGRLTKLISGSRISSQQNSKQADGYKEESIKSKNIAQVNSEANQLLDELDHSLDLVSRDCSPYLRKPTALSWWNMVGGSDQDTMMFERQAKVGNCCEKVERKSARSHHDIIGSSSSDSNFQYEDGQSDRSDDDYASINKAMINATLGVDINGQSGKGLQSVTNEASSNPMAVNTNGTAINLSSHLSIEAGSPSDSFTFSIPSSIETSPACSHVKQHTDRVTASELRPAKGRLEGCADHLRRDSARNSSCLNDNTACVISSSSTNLVISHKRIGGSENSGSTRFLDAEGGCSSPSKLNGSQVQTRNGEIRLQKDGLIGSNRDSRQHEQQLELEGLSSFKSNNNNDLDGECCAQTSQLDSKNRNNPADADNDILSESVLQCQEFPCSHAESTKPAAEAQQQVPAKCHQNAQVIYLRDPQTATGTKLTEQDGSIQGHLPPTRGDSCSCCCRLHDDVDGVGRMRTVANNGKNMSDSKQEAVCSAKHHGSCANKRCPMLVQKHQMQNKTCECYLSSKTSPNDLHINAKGITFSKTTAPTGEKLRNQLIIGHGCCDSYPSCRLLTNSQGKDKTVVHLNPSELRKSPPAKRSTDIESNQKISSKASRGGVSGQSQDILASSYTKLHSKPCCVGMQQKEQQETASGARRNAMTSACHHCPSRREANYNEDVKLNCCQVVCMSGSSNLVSNQQSADGKKGFVASKKGTEIAASEDCTCQACRPVEILQHQPSCPVVSRLSRLPKDTSISVAKTTDHKLSSGRQMCHADLNCQHKFANGSGNGFDDRLSGSPICLTNGEKVHDLRSAKPAQTSDTSSNSSNSKQLCSVHQKQQFSGGHRNLRPVVVGSNAQSSQVVPKKTAAKEPSRSAKATELSCSQISLANYYNASTHFVSPFIPTDRTGQQAISSKVGVPHNNELSVVDDNFILKRKTPNAGLKLHG